MSHATSTHPTCPIIPLQQHQSVLITHARLLVLTDKILERERNLLIVR